MTTSTPIAIRITRRAAPRHLEPQPANAAAEPASTGALPRPDNAKSRGVLHLHRPAHSGQRPH